MTVIVRESIRIMHRLI